MKEYKPILEMCLQLIREKGEDAFVTICNCAIPSYVVLFEHDRLGKKIESLPQEERQAMWEYVFEKFPKHSKEDRVKFCKIIHCIGELI